MIAFVHAAMPRGSLHLDEHTRQHRLATAQQNSSCLLRVPNLGVCNKTACPAAVTNCDSLFVRVPIGVSLLERWRPMSVSCDPAQ